MEAGGAMRRRALQLVRTLRALEGPSPSARLPPGYLRALTAEAAPQVGEGAAAAAASSSSSGAATAQAATGRAAAAEAAAAELSASSDSSSSAAASAAQAAAHGGAAGGAAHVQGGRAPRDDQRLRLSSFEGLTQILAQQQVALVERTGALREWAPASPALQAMTWHQRFFNETPAGEPRLAALPSCRAAFCACLSPGLLQKPQAHARRDGPRIQPSSCVPTASASVLVLRDCSAAARQPAEPTPAGPPAGRELRRNWQRQVILETKAMEATRARYQKEQASALVAAFLFHSKAGQKEHCRPAGRPAGRLAPASLGRSVG